MFWRSFGRSFHCLARENKNHVAPLTTVRVEGSSLQDLLVFLLRIAERVVK